MTCLYALLTVAIAGPGSPRAGLSVAHEHLRAGRPVMARRAYQSLLDANPSLARAQVGVGLALVNEGRCTEALEAFAGVRNTRGFRVDAYMAEARCAMRDGDDATAVERYEEALAVRPNQVDLLFSYISVLVARGDHERAREAIDHLVVVDPDGRFAGVSSARAALGTSQFDIELMSVLGSLEVDENTRSGLLLLAGRQRLLDGSNAAAAQALALLVRRKLNDVQANLWYAEALRRMGHADSAMRLLENKGLGDYRTRPLARAIRARVFTDLANYRAARAELDGHPDPSDPEHAASAWYLSRAEGRSTAPHRKDFSNTALAEHGSLEDLIPWSY